VRVELVFERNTSCNSCVSGGDRLCWLQTGIFRGIEETHVSLQRKPSVVEAAACSTLTPCENCVSFGKNISANHSFPVGDRLCLL
jgi:predicted hydrocarbon binding protein